MAKCKYETYVKPRFKEIKDWIANGATQEQVAKNLGISVRSLIKYLNDYSDFAELYKSGQTDLVKELRGALMKRAFGFQYTESEKTVEYGKVIKEVTKVKTALPDVAAINLALKNYDRENWANDPQMLELKKEELKFKKENFENENW